jgi:hypothetical protein
MQDEMVWAYIIEMHAYKIVSKSLKKVWVYMDGEYKNCVQPGHLLTS